MKNGIIDRCFAPAAPVAGSRCTLRAIWQVEADPSYQVRRNRPRSLGILLRTLRGAGTVRLADGAVLPTRPGEALYFDNATIAAYGTASEEWQFRWFEFEGEIALPPARPLPIPNRSWEAPFFDHLQELAGRSDAASAQAASELFGGYLLGLLAESERQERQCDRRIAGTLDRIDRSAPRIPPVGELARRCNLCERRFRALFWLETGETPKQYCEKVRLRPAGHLLLEGSRPIKEIAAMLGYPSQFAFSAAFRKCYGVPPSRYRRA